MINTYRYKFSAKCPANDDSIEYSLTIKSRKMIWVEEIVTVCADLEATQESIAEYLKEIFTEASIKMVGTHLGVKIVTKV